MSELTTIDTNNYEAMAQMMGMAYDAQEKKSGLARIKINKTAVMGEAQVNGKTMKAELLQAGSILLESGDGKELCASSATVRPFMQRFMYQKYDNDKGNYQKTLMAENLDVDLKDTNGTFNCGKPGGYIKDFDSLPDGQKELIRQIRRVRVIFGTIDMKGITKGGEEQSVKDVPFIWEVDSKEGFKNLGAAFNKLSNIQRLPIQHMMKIEVETRQLPTGSTYYVPTGVFNTKDKIEINLDVDQPILKEFASHVEGFNKWVMSEWDKATENNMSSDEENIVDGFIDVDVEADVN